MILKRMLKEEWRTQSKMYRGRYLAALPVIIFLMTFFGGQLVTNFSTAPVTDLGLLVMAFGFFTGLAAGSIGFNSSDAAKNVLGESNFLIFSSRTLPVRKTSLIAGFLIKDLIFYIGLYLLPVAAAMLLVSAQMLTSVIYMGLLFVAGLTLSLVTASTAIRLPSKTSILSYNNLPIPSLARKSVLDVSRSSGGLLKIIMSMFILLGLYWYIVNYIPLASYLLSNPLMSFAVVLGMMSVTVYNWLNTYDELENYQYLPVDKRELLKSKFQAFKLISTIIITLLISSSYLLYGGDLILSLAIALTTAYYIGAVTMFESGLNPNEKMINGWVFTKFLIIVNILVIPLLALTSLNVDSHVIIGLLVPMLVIGKIAEKIKIG